MALSIVVPVYGCESCLGELVERVEAAVRSMGVSWEIILVDDRSPDRAWDGILEIAHRHPAVRGIRLSRNFGQHAAITAGLSYANGDRVVVMDCDLQDSPEDIPRLYEKASEGYDIVYARRHARKDSPIRGLASRAYFKLLNTFVGTRFTAEYGTFSIIDRKVVDSYLRVQDRARHYLLILYWLGYDYADIEVEHRPRAGGKSGYSFQALIGHAVDGLFFQTTVLLRWIVYLGFALATLGAVLAVVFIVVYLTANPYPGWTSLGVLLLLIGGFIIMSTGVAGLYIGKIFEQVRVRPLFVVDDEVGS